jgi:hypothetical protein
MAVVVFVLGLVTGRPNARGARLDVMLSKVALKGNFYQ